MSDQKDDAVRYVRKNLASCKQALAILQAEREQTMRMLWEFDRKMDFLDKEVVGWRGVLRNLGEEDA